MGFWARYNRRMEPAPRLWESDDENRLLTLAEAGEWASREFGRAIDAQNIGYLVNYGRVPKINGDGRGALVRLSDLREYYRSRRGLRERYFKRRLGEDINWRLSFEECRESETTKHVHRLHPYKGKFIPQLAEYFLDSRVDEFKTESCFAPGDIVLDPFCGSGTTLVQANELGLHAVGIDISAFNAAISNLKLTRANSAAIAQAAKTVAQKIEQSAVGKRARACEVEILDALRAFNEARFPSPEFKRRVRTGEIDESSHGEKMEKAFLPRYQEILARHKVDARPPDGGGFLEKWYAPAVRAEMRAAKAAVDAIDDNETRGVLRIVLSRAVRSSRATTHSDLATLVEPIFHSYYCGKHGKICKPIFSMLGWWRRYAQDTAARIESFSRLRTDTRQMCLTGDARGIDIAAALEKRDPKLAATMRRKKIRGIFSSPPYVGLIDYHDQHAYAYELFGLKRRDEDEIGAMAKGRGREARENYAAGIAAALQNSRRFLRRDFDIFLVANDNFGLYPQIAARAGLRVVKEYKRPVLNRAEGSKSAYGESIFHMKEA